MIYWILLPFVNTVGNIKYLYDHCTSRKTQAKERQLQYPKSCVVTFIQLWPNFCQSVWCSRVRPGQRGWVEQHHSLQGEGSSPYIVIILYSPSHLLGATTVVFFFLSKQLKYIGLEYQVYWYCPKVLGHLSPILLMHYISSLLHFLYHLPPQRTMWIWNS